MHVQPECSNVDSLTDVVPFNFAFLPVAVYLLAPIYTASFIITVIVVSGSCLSCTVPNTTTVFFLGRFFFDRARRAIHDLHQ